MASGKKSELDIVRLGRIFLGYKIGMKCLVQVALIGLTFLGVRADEFAVKEIMPPKEESAWLEIDWKTDLWEDREEASRTGKPICLWEMVGHPLGCV